MLSRKVLTGVIVSSIMVALILTFPGVLMADGHEGPGIERTEEIIMAYINPEDPADFHDMNYVTDDVTFYNMSMGGIPMTNNREELENYLYWFYNEAFETEVEIRNMVISNGEAVLEWTVMGTHIGEFYEIPATGNTIEIPMIARYKLQDHEPYHVEQGWVYPMANLIMAQLLAE